MDIKTENKITIETTAFFENGIWKTHDCKLYEWWGEDRCKEINFDKKIKEIEMLKGEYKIIITMEKLNKMIK